MEGESAYETVSISGEVLSIHKAPSPTSKLVRQAKDDILCNVDPTEFGKDIETVANLMAVAFDAAIVLEQTDVTLAVQDIGFQLTNTTEKAHLTMFGLGVSASGAVGDLEAILSELYRPGGVDTVAVAMLEGVQSTACEMSRKCTGMSEKFQAMADATKSALEVTQAAIASRRNQVLEHRTEARAAEGRLCQAVDAHKTLTRTVFEINNVLEEAKSRELWAHRRGAWVSFVDNITRIVQPLLGTEAAMKDAAGKNRRDVKCAARNVSVIATDRLSALERRAEAMSDMVNLVQKIRNSRTEADFAAVLIEALYAAAGALKRLSTQMLKSAALWSQLEAQATRLGNPDELGRLVRTACSSYPEFDERRAAFWQSTAFKRRAVVYVARWVAIAEVGRTTSVPIGDARRALYSFLESHPSYDTVAERLDAI